jgi:hypothetical protein
MTTQFEGYAETIIDDPANYDALEIQGVSETPDTFGMPGETICEVDNDHPNFFSVYAHLAEGGVECIGDFATVADARTYAAQIVAQYGREWPIEDFTTGVEPTPPAPKMNWGGPDSRREGDICPCCWNPYVWIEDGDERTLVCAC